jgi:signal transduction histidine kinase
MSGRLFCDRRMLAVVIGVGLAVAATAWSDYVSGVDGRLFVVDVLVGVIGLALLPALSRWPVATALVLSVLAAVAPTATPLADVGTLHVARQRPFTVAVGVAGFGIAAQAMRDVWRPQTGLSFMWWVILIAVSQVALVGWGALVKARRALIQSLCDRAERAEAEQGRRVAEARAAERARIAREMHDVLAHRLSLLATYAGALEYRPDAPPEQLSHAAGVIRSTVHQALDELRDVITLLREDTEDGQERPVPALADLPELVEESRAVGTRVDVRDDLSDPTALPGTTARTAYRVVQEALTNARKHAPGQPVSIALNGAPGTQLVIDVSNPLTGRPSVIPGTATGLIGLTERVRLAGGQLDHRAAAGEFRLHARLPWPG